MRDDRFSDEALRSAFRALVDEADDQGGPDAGRVWDAALGSSPVAERRQVIDEIARRPGAALSWRLARALQAELEPSVQQEARRPARPTVARRIVHHGAWAAAAALVLVIGAWALRSGTTATAATTETPSYRDPDPGRRGQMRSDVPGDQALDRARFVLRWSPAAEGALYDVRVMTESLVEITSARDLVRPELVVPAPDLRALASGSRILWQVTARLPSGAEVRSETFVSAIR